MQKIKDEYLKLLFLMFRPTFASKGESPVKILYSRLLFLYLNEEVRTKRDLLRAINALEENNIIERVPDSLYKEKVQEICYLTQGSYWDSKWCADMRKHLSFLTENGIEAIRKYLCDKVINGCEAPVEEYLSKCVSSVSKLRQKLDSLVKDFAMTILYTAHFLQIIDSLSMNPPSTLELEVLISGNNRDSVVFPDFFVTYKRESIMIYLFTGRDEKDIEQVSRSAEIAKTYGKTAIWPATKMKRETLAKYLSHFSYVFETEVSKDKVNISVTPTADLEAAH